MRVRAVDFVVYNVPDMKRAKAFYHGTLGLPRGGEYTGFWAEFATEPVALCLCDPYPGPWEGGTAVALAVDDVSAAVDELRANGVSILMEPTETGVCRIAFVADPFGNRICLHQRKDGTAG
jgi:predicted enzyme related to lactoylglutathione lyase